MAWLQYNKQAKWTGHTGTEDKGLVVEGHRG